MTDKEINHEIAGYLGWKPKYLENMTDPISWIDPTGSHWPSVYAPVDYCERIDHIAMAEHLLPLALHTAWIDNLCLIANGPTAENDGSYVEVGKMLLATPKQRALAFVQTIGKYKE